nr:ras-related protein Rab-3D [Meriones unguiculatus]
MASASEPPASPRDAADQNFDYMFKLLLIGNSSVGKTSFLFRYADDSFTPAFVSTVGIDFKVKTVYRHDKRIKLQIWVGTLVWSSTRGLGWLASKIHQPPLPQAWDCKRVKESFEFFEASAKESINVKQVFERLVDIICEKMNESLEPSASPGSNGKGPTPGDTPPPQPSSCGC